MIPVVTKVHPAGDDHQVLTVEGGNGAYRKKPCPNCPWRTDAAGIFSAEAFRISAHTAFDMSTATFGCHQSGKNKPAVCAGFLLRGAGHNLAVRLGILNGKFKDDVTDGGHELHENYRAMAIANGVPDNDTAIALCRD